MYVLMHENGLCVKNLAGRLNYSESTVSHALEEPHARGLVEGRQRGRPTEQWLTPEGRSVVEAWLEPYLQLLAATPPAEWLSLGEEFANCYSDGSTRQARRSNGRSKR